MNRLAVRRALAAAVAACATLAGCSSGGDGKAAPAGPIPPAVAAALGGTLYVLAGSSPISANLWEVTSRGSVVRELTHNPDGYGISWVSASPAGIVLADAIDGVDALYRLASSGPQPVPTDFVDPPAGIGVPTTASPSIDPAGEVAFVTPAIVVRKTADNAYLVWVKSSFRAPAHVAFERVTPPLGGEVWGPAGQLAVPGNTGIPPFAGVPRVILVLRPGRPAVRLDPALPVFGDVTWGSLAPAIALDDQTAQSELLYTDGRRQLLPHGWLVLAWSPDGRHLLLARGTTYGLWSPAAPDVVQPVGRVPDAAHIYQVVWLAHPAPASR